MKSKTLKMMMKMKSTINMPSPASINLWWNLGSTLMMMMTIQVGSGLLLSMNYCPDIEKAFESVYKISNNMNYGWMIRYTHVNTASALFLLMFIHTARGMYFSSYKKKGTWMIGMMLFIMMMMTAFMGYVLPWGQMSFWGATVITNLMSAIPYIGGTMVEWIWGGFSINSSTLGRFYSIHFLLPFMIMFTMTMHIMALHSRGSSNPMGLKSHLLMIPLNPYFTLKDYLMFMMMLIMMSLMIMQYTTNLMDPDNFIKANPMITPPHIKPEWYFLFAYSILRSIPNKLGGVMCLMMSIMILFTLPLYKQNSSSLTFLPPIQIMFWVFINTFILLTWTGGMPIQDSITNLSIILTIMYFSIMVLMPMSKTIKTFK